MKILVFTEGTIIMHQNAQGHTREEIAEQCRLGQDSSLFEWKTYIPNGKSPEKLRAWKNQGAKIFYLTSTIKPEDISDIKQVLEKYDFPDNQNLLFKKEGEGYKDVAEKLMPDILIEDDCESIGGESEMTYTHIRPDLKTRIKSIVVKEFGGIDHLPDKLALL